MRKAAPSTTTTDLGILEQATINILYVHCP